MRLFSLIAAAVSIALPLLLEIIGVLPASYSFSEQGLLVMPQMIDLPQGVMLPFMLVASLAIGILPALMVARLRHELTTIERKHLTQMWHFRRLGDDLIRAADHPAAKPV